MPLLANVLVTPYSIGTGFPNYNSNYFSSPVRQRSLDKNSPPKQLPQRPPPPKIALRKAATLKETVSPTRNFQNHSFDVEHSISKPKPPIRTRKKKFFATESVKHPMRQSEFVELSTSDIIVDFGNQGDEIRIVPNVTVSSTTVESVSPEQQQMVTVTEDVVVEEVGGVEDEEEMVEDAEKKTPKEIDLDRDDWEVIAAAEDSDTAVMNERCLQPNG